MDNQPEYEYSVAFYTVNCTYPTLRRYNKKTKEISYYNFVENCFMGALGISNSELYTLMERSKKLTVEEVTLLIIQYGK